METIMFSRPEEDAKYLTSSAERDQYYVICQAARILADLNHDHASTLNGMGYNKYDTEFGEKWARIAWDRWTPAVISGIYKMLYKYRQQLAGHGIDYGKIPNPVGFGKGPKLDETLQEGRNAPARPTGNEYKQLKFKENDPDTLEVEWRGVDRETFAAIHTAIAPIGKFCTVGGVANPNYQFDRSQPRWREKPVRSYWEVSLNPANAVIIREVARRFGFYAETAVQLKIKQMAKEATLLHEMSRKVADTFEIPGFGHPGLQPYPFQQAGIKYAVQARYAGIFDDMGLGKTIQAMGTLYYLKAFPALIVVPKVVLINWQREWKRWAPDVRVMRIDSHTTAQMIALGKPDVVLVNYDILAKLLPELSQVEWLAVVFDEAHRLKNPQAQRSKAAHILATGGRDKSRGVGVRLLLTGTPLINRPPELIHLLKIMGTFGVMFKTEEEFYKKHYWNGTLQNGVALHELLRQVCMVRRKKEDVLTELPPITRVAVPIELTNEAEYRDAERNILAWIRDEARKDKAFLETIRDLPADVQAKMIAAHENDAVARAKRAKAVVRIEKLKQICVKGKLNAFKEWVDEVIQSERKFVVFTTHRKVQMALHAHWKNDALILGGMSDKARQAEIDRFMQDPETLIASCALKAAGEGITLTAASEGAFVEFDWTPAGHDQCESRIHRIGQKDAVTWYYMVGIRTDGERTIDEDMFELLDSKRSTVNAVADGIEELAEQESLVKILMKRMAERAERRTDLPAVPVFDNEEEEVIE